VALGLRIDQPVAVRVLDPDDLVASGVREEELLADEYVVPRRGIDQGLDVVPGLALGGVLAVLVLVDKGVRPVQGSRWDENIGALGSLSRGQRREDPCEECRRGESHGWSDRLWYGRLVRRIQYDTSGGRGRDMKPA
jgi:hypothetical protein